MPTKKAVWKILKPKCSYKTLAVNLNRWSSLAGIILAIIMSVNRASQHLVKHINSTDIPVCLFKNAHRHKTKKGLADFGRSSKSIFFGLKLRIIADLRKKLLAIKFTGGAVDDRKIVIPLSKEILGILIADAGYISGLLPIKLNLLT